MGKEGTAKPVRVFKSLLEEGQVSQPRMKTWAQLCEQQEEEHSWKRTKGPESTDKLQVFEEEKEGWCSCGIMSKSRVVRISTGGSEVRQIEVKYQYLCRSAL